MTTETYSHSVVQLCPDASHAPANAIADASGYGPDNLSRQLIDGQGGIWWGCHAWWIPRVLAEMTAPTGDPAIDDVLAQVVTSTVDTTGMTDSELSAVALQNWQSALAANGLSVVEPAP
ncbi:hypothetical protein [Pseudomonas sp.]|uniref:hypothetical protein n=1 Tax=Pseudomonas sp. TaxID=306 RepID=UPI002587470E|nr:hypothetical protein [Pseudomonas sp.]